VSRRLRFAGRGRPRILINDMGEKRGIFLKIVVRGATFVRATGLVEKM